MMDALTKFLVSCALTVVASEIVFYSIASRLSNIEKAIDRLTEAIKESNK